MTRARLPLLAGALLGAGLLLAVGLRVLALPDKAPQTGNSHALSTTQKIRDR